METLGIKNKGLMLFGIIFLVIGLVASFYEIATWFDHEEIIKREYPYQTIGIMLDLVGIVFIALGFFYPMQKTPPPPPQKT